MTPETLVVLGGIIQFIYEHGAQGVLVFIIWAFATDRIVTAKRHNEALDKIDQLLKIAISGTSTSEKALEIAEKREAKESENINLMSFKKQEREKSDDILEQMYELEKRQAQINDRLSVLVAEAGVAGRFIPNMESGRD